MRSRPGLAALAWVAIPVAVYLLTLRHVWFNVPAWDDYEAMLQWPMMLMDARSMRQWLQTLVMQHNEHRIAFARLVAWTMATAVGRIDFRILVLLGNLAWIGVMALLWGEFRERVAAPLFMAAAFLLLQWSYWESSMLAMAALSNMGVVLFSLASLFFAVRDGNRALVLAIAFGVLAAGTQGNGLFVLPIAAAGCLLLGRGRRALAFALPSVALWTAYFHGYVRPANHPSPMVAFAQPLDAVQLFLVVIGGIAPGRWPPMALGAAMLAAIAWLARRGAWRSHPACGLWVAFIVASAAAATVARVGFGVYHAPRYNLYSSALAAMLLPLAFEVLDIRRRVAVIATVAGCAVISLLVSRAGWTNVHDYSFSARLLAEAVPVEPASTSRRYFGVLHPSLPTAEGILAEAQRRRLYVPPRAMVQPSAWVMADSAPPHAAAAGHLDEPQVSGNVVTLRGWTHLPATLPGRMFTLSPAADVPVNVTLVVTPRPDIALAHARADLVFAGFEMALRYASPEEAARAGGQLCVCVEAPGHAPVAVSGSKGCPS